MKSEKGVTLTSLTIYIIVLIIVVTIVTVITSFFNENVNQTASSIDPLVEYTRLTSYITEQVNITDIEVLDYGNYDSSTGIINGNSFVLFSDNTIYTFIKENNSIYKGTVKITSGVEQCTFHYDSSTGVLTVEMTMKTDDKVWKNTYKI